MGKCFSTGGGNKPALRKTNSQILQAKSLQKKQSSDDYGFLTFPPDSNGSQVSKSKSNILSSPSTEGKENRKPQQNSHQPILSPQDQMFQKNQLQIDDQFNRYNTRSQIIKLSKPQNKRNASSIVSKKNKPKNNQQYLKDVEFNQVLQGVFTNRDINSTLCIKNADIDMQFSLPRCRAGPLTVPFIEYNQYSQLICSNQ